MNIAFFGLADWEQEYVSGKLTEANLQAEFFARPLDVDNLPTETNFDVISVFVKSRVNASVLDKFPNLKLVAARSTGFDHIDLEECKKRGITVSSVPSYGENTVAEFTFALILALSRKICEANERVSQGSFNLDGLRGFDLAGKTLGVVGTGNIGKNVIQIAHGFDMKIIACDVKPNEDLAKQYGFTYAPFEEVLKNADVVTLHVPYMESTHHMINKENIGMMKKGAYLVNTARGGVVETEALVEALKSGLLGGAGLDVLEEEGVIHDELDFLAGAHPNAESLRMLLQNHALIAMPNVIVTPHNAFDTEEAIKRILDTTLANITEFIGGKPQNVVS